MKRYVIALGQGAAGSRCILFDREKVLGAAQREFTRRAADLFAVSHHHKERPRLNDIFIPTALFWENGNTWYGSKGQARFYIRPVKHEPPEDRPEAAAHTALEVELWKGPLTRALSEIVATASFPLSEEGLAQTTQWLEERAAELN